MTKLAVIKPSLGYATLPLVAGVYELKATSDLPELLDTSSRVEIRRKS